MHECPDCGMACDCDGEDMWVDDPFIRCTHECDDDDDDDDWYVIYGPDADPDADIDAMRRALEG